MPKKLSEVKEAIRIHDGKTVSALYRLGDIARNLHAVGLTKPGDEIDDVAREIRANLMQLNLSIQGEAK